MFYTLKVEWDDGDKSIVIGNDENDNDKENNIITKVTVHMDTIGDSRTKSEQMLSKIHIEGKISKDTTVVNIYDKLRDFFLWSIDYDGSTTYRKVTINVKATGGTKLRGYEFENLFVSDYKEIYDRTDGDKDGTFCLDLIQRENELHTIQVF